jgi:hypothetical protein
MEGKAIVEVEIWREKSASLRINESDAWFRPFGSVSPFLHSSSRSFVCSFIRSDIPEKLKTQ